MVLYTVPSSTAHISIRYTDFIFVDQTVTDVLVERAASICGAEKQDEDEDTRSVRNKDRFVPERTISRHITVTMKDCTGQSLGNISWFMWMKVKVVPVLNHKSHLGSSRITP